MFSFIEPQEGGTIEQSCVAIKWCTVDSGKYVLDFKCFLVVVGHALER